MHLAHLGTMGVYGYTTAGLRIPEGYLKVTVDTDYGPAEQEILFPPNPGWHCRDCPYRSRCWAWG